MLFGDRRFELWAYSVSHQSLLLRSTRVDGTGSRIDVLFKGVTRLSLPTTLDALSIEPDPKSPSIPPLGGEETNRWVLVSRSGRGFIDAVTAAIHEDELEFFAPTPLWDQPA